MGRTRGDVRRPPPSLSIARSVFSSRAPVSRPHTVLRFSGIIQALRIARQPRRCPSTSREGRARRLLVLLQQPPSCLPPNVPLFLSAPQEHPKRQVQHGISISNSREPLVPRSPRRQPHAQHGRHAQRQDPLRLPFRR